MYICVVFLQESSFIVINAPYLKDARLRFFSLQDKRMYGLGITCEALERSLRYPPPPPTVRRPVMVYRVQINSRQATQLHFVCQKTTHVVCRARV